MTKGEYRLQNHTASGSIAGNTILLYVRMLVAMIAAFYTSRVVLIGLGVENFGIYGAVSGLVLFFSFLNIALAGTTQRFITVSLGVDSKEESAKVFSMSINCHALICVLVLLLAESVGLWFLNHRLSIPDDKLSIANIVYQLTLVSCVMNIFTAPFIGCVIAYEKMRAFAIISMVEYGLKLGAGLALFVAPARDRLLFFAILTVVAGTLVLLLYHSYCRRKLPVCRYVRSRSGDLFRRMMSFAGWNLLKDGADMCVGQGGNIIVNVFCGPAATAAVCIANQVGGAVYNFVLNVQTAANPQITKFVSRGEWRRGDKLITSSAKFAYMLLSLIGVPLALQMPRVLQLWLSEVPPGTALLCVSAIVAVSFEALAGPFNIAILARGEIRNYRIVTSLMLASTLAAIWLMLRLGWGFEYVFVARMATQLAVMIYTIGRARGCGCVAKTYATCNFMIRPWMVSGVVIAVGVWIVSVLDFGVFGDVAITALYTTFALSAGYYFICLNSREMAMLRGIARRVLPYVGR